MVGIGLTRKTLYRCVLPPVRKLIYTNKTTNARKLKKRKKTDKKKKTHKSWKQVKELDKYTPEADRYDYDASEYYDHEEEKENENELDVLSGFDTNNENDDVEQDEQREYQFVPLPRRPLLLTRQVLAIQEDVLLSYGFGEWAASIAGGGKDSAEMTTLLRITIQFLMRWLAAAQQLGQGIDESWDIMDFFVGALAKLSLFAALANLIQKYPHKGGTLSIHIYAFVASTSFLLTQPQALMTKGFNTGLNRTIAYLTKTVALVKKVQNKKDRRTDKSVAKCVLERRWPQQGLAQLQAKVVEDIEEIKLKLAMPAADLSITQEFYKYFMQVLFFSLYVLAPNGRIGGIAALMWKHRNEILQSGVAYSTRFKTEGVYMFQPVIFAQESRDLLQLYLSILRPFALGPFTVAIDSDYLLIDCNGKKLSSTTISAWIIGYSHDAFNLSLNSTTLRSIAETHAEERLQLGLITQVERDAVNVTEGHSSRTAKLVYAKNNMKLTVINAMVAYGGEVLPVPPVAIVVLPVKSYGEEHPSRNLNKSRAEWSPAEVEYLEDFIDRALEQGIASHPGNIMADALRAIQQDDSARRIFHIIHVQSSGRLRNGCRKYLERKVAEFREAAAASEEPPPQPALHPRNLYSHR